MATFRHVPKDIRADAPIWGHLVDLPHTDPVTVTVRLGDELGHAWQSEAVYQVSSQGTVNLAAGKPIRGAWSGPDAYGLYWSMARRPSEAKSSLSGLGTGLEAAFEVATASSRPLQVEVTGRVRYRTVATATFARHFLFRATKGEWRDDLTANLFVPHFPAASQGVLVIAGSEGGFAWSNQVAALIAASGRAALAVAYFDWQGAHGLPSTLAEIPLEIFCEALDRLREDPRVLSGDLAVVGFSKGAEAALLLATKRKDIRKVVAYSPSAHVWESARMDPALPPRSSWSWRGKPIPFVQFNADREFYRTFDKTVLGRFHERALADKEAVCEARIPVEEVGARVLLISGTADSVWPATSMSKAIVNDFAERNRLDQVQHLAFKGAGHTFFVPGMPAVRMDGLPELNARADRWSWAAIRAHLGLS